MDEKSNLAQLAEAFDGHQITDEDGARNEGETDTPVAEPAGDEQTTESPVVEEQPAQKENADPVKEEAKDDEHEVAEDDSGNKYIPQKRFDKVYGKLKSAERERDEMKAKLQQGEQILQEHGQSAQQQPKVNSVEAVEIELLRMQMPEFDPTSDQYSKTLDSLGAQIFKANKGITRLEAARRAKSMAADLALKSVEAKQESRVYKQQNSDQGITNRVVNRVQTQKKPEEMTESEMEAWMKSNGLW